MTDKTPKKERNPGEILIDDVDIKDLTSLANHASKQAGALKLAVMKAEMKGGS